MGENGVQGVDVMDEELCVSWGVWWSLVWWGCDDAKEGLKFSGSKVVGEEPWIDQV